MDTKAISNELLNSQTQNHRAGLNRAKGRVSGSLTATAPAPLLATQQDYSNVTILLSGNSKLSLSSVPAFLLSP